jgi:hypothetical protein
MKINPARILGGPGVEHWFSGNHTAIWTPGPDPHSKERTRDAMMAIRVENVSSNRGVGPWVTRSAGWRQKQRRKLARRTA